MNEKIKQLAEQAGFHVADGKIYIPTTSEDITECQKKFAELIIQECIDVMDATAKDAKDTNMYMGDDVPTFTHQYAIKDHFGVE